MNAIADTGWIVALRNRRDAHHEWAKAIAAGLTLPVLVCEAVLAEAAFHLGSTGEVLKMLRSGALKLSFRLEEHQERISELGTAYADRKPDLADLCVIRMSELFKRNSVLTVDRDDFEIYRRFRDERIPFLAPLHK
ncbi:MAG: PIN domain-containing protein [Verrucomicrobiota bacterium]